MDFNINKKNLLYFFIIFFTSFLSWVIFSFNLEGNVMNDLLKTKIYNSIDNSKYQKNDINLEKIEEVYLFLKNEYYDSDIIKKDKIIESSIKWMVKWLWDKHSEYLTQEEKIKFNEILSWDFEWIWAIVEKTQLWVIIDRVLKWSPANKNWLLKWDILTEANWINLKDLDLYDAVDKIKWPNWTKVVLKIIRKWKKEILEKKIIRQRIKIPSVDFKKLENKNQWYISINMFWEDTNIELKKAIENLKDTKWIIIDLRNNGWWYLQSAVSILSNFIKNGENLVFTRYKNSFKNVVYKSVNNGDIYTWKIVVIINNNSASASEITAWALRDYNKAILVWNKSYWKWSVQKPFNLSDGWMLKLTIARWFTPNNKDIDKEWINPDIEVKIEEKDYEDEYDRQLEVAKKVLNTFIKYWSLKLGIDKYNSSIIKEEDVGK